MQEQVKNLYNALERWHERLADAIMRCDSAKAQECV